MIHQYKNSGLNIVMDIESGSVHVVDDIVYDIVHALDAMDSVSDFRKVSDGEVKASDFSELEGYLKFMLSKYNDEDIEEAYNEVKELIEEERLFTDDIYKDFVMDFKKRTTVVKALCLHIAHDCNLACKYCFADEGEYHGKRELMSYEVGKKALDFLVANSGSRTNLEVDFFGGEPLMNFEVVKQLVKYGRSLEEPNNKKFRFTLTTNGVLLDDDILEFANKEMSNLVLSLDGRKEVHDLMRPRRGGQGSYDTVVPKFIKAAESRNQMNYYVRGTYTRNNLDFAKDVIHMADLGFEQISVEPVVADKSESYAIREEDIDTLIKQYDELTAEMIKRKKEGKPFNFFHFMIDLSGGPCVAKRLSGCGSGTEYLAVSPSGELYPCHQFMGMKDFLLGNVDEGVIRTDIRDEFKLCNVYAKEKCKNCFAKFYCSGGCAANSYNFSGSINGTYEIGCELQKKRIECAIALKALEFNE
ncbi:MAG: thioether cross-link-forming SCIFF peptide maturase [Lachnospiraceae bacterium]|nr:thioether cross-link-forming SCIFF peptide maturase [Lachnospiraceae bacterium]MCI6977198.1 thioether cross-link-forming SCIFF peptide maturase [Lachnospiraceae bacterium]MDD6580738.1 thioether cross-link-forming SCIFF peptide maturase [Lachnospiraceae bacterium]MDD7222817.1 thioether cross-link-forming SCIFF peptide maturase [Lachnospiraceae bacterium]